MQAAHPPSDHDAFELVVGLETHVQLVTASKMFCACAADADLAAPNTRTCPVCLGLPGALPVPNAHAVALAVRAALALGCTVHAHTRFERKSYHYPDLPKGYQISQYTRPLGTGGGLDVDVEGRAGHVRLERLHIEEDTARLVHAAGETRVDFNRAGIPLVEIVTRPDLRSPDAAAAYVETLRHLLRWIGVSTAAMASGALRVDVNCSLRRFGDPALGTKVEIKNLNSIAAVRAALAYERRRQAACLARGEAVAHETRGWDEAAGRTTPQRGKEHAHDYRYFPEPDLPPLVLPEAWLTEQRAALPELPAARRGRLVAAHGLRPEDARLLTRDRATADYFEAVLATDGATRADPEATPPGPGAGPAPAPATSVAAWITGPLFAALYARGLDVAAVRNHLPPAHLAALVALVASGVVTANVGKRVLGEMIDTGSRARDIVDRDGLAQVDDAADLRRIAEGVVAANPKAVADYRAGKTASLGFLIGGVMKATHAQANPDAARRAVVEALERSAGG